MPRFIRELPEGERPIYRASNGGLAALSEAELLQIVTGLTDLDAAQRLLDHFGSIGALSRASPAEIRRVATGIGRSRSAQIAAAFELARRLMIASSLDRMQIRSPADAVHLLRAAIGEQLQEHLVVICLDTKNRIQKVHTAYIGSVNSAQVRVAEIYREAIRLNSVAVIIAHNHPSGDPSPSPEDIMVTRQFVDAGKLLDIECLDHIIIGGGRHVSLRERGLGFNH